MESKDIYYSDFNSFEPPCFYSPQPQGYITEEEDFINLSPPSFESPQGYLSNEDLNIDEQAVDEGPLYYLPEDLYTEDQHLSPLQEHDYTQSTHSRYQSRNIHSSHQRYTPHQHSSGDNDESDLDIILRDIDHATAPSIRYAL